MEILNYLEAAVSITVLIGFICGVVNYVLVSPINKSINILNSSINCLNNTISKIIDNNHEFDKRLAIQENAVENLHERFEIIQSVLDKINNK